ncbi:MAG: rhodanese-like domain-containing protein [Woeseiaceae bacterium]|nr:rhodanese-like domain-containing protein [Woeseiaceae bacterium]
MKPTTKILILLPAATLLAACNPAAPDAGLVDVAQAAARQTDRVSVEDLASWIIEGRQDFALVDVRPATDFDAGHIGAARNVPVAMIVSDETLASLPTDRKIVVYSNGSENGAKAATLLRVAGFDAYVVTGGYNAWNRRILNPDIPAAEYDGESLESIEQRAYACYFVGDRGGAAAERPEVDFVPPVYRQDEADDVQPLPPAGEESC